MTEATTNSKFSQALSTFGKKPKGAILAPNTAFNVRNNCQIGQWSDGSREYGSKADLIVVKFSNFYGNLGQTKSTFWGQLWAVCYRGDVPKNTFFCTYLKTESLANFNNLVVSIQAENDDLDPANGIFKPRFEKRTKSLDDGNTANYYAIVWSWEPIKEETKESTFLNSVANAFNENFALLHDPKSTENMICLDGMDPEDRDAAIAIFNEQQKALESGR
jgi:hypothetical protein